MDIFRGLCGFRRGIVVALGRCSTHIFIHKSLCDMYLFIAVCTKIGMAGFSDTLCGRVSLSPPPIDIQQRKDSTSPANFVLTQPRTS